MPRSQNKRIADILDIIKSDDILRRKLLETFLSALRTEYHFKGEIIDIIERELADRFRRAARSRGL